MDDLCLISGNLESMAQDAILTIIQEKNHPSFLIDYKKQMVWTKEGYPLERHQVCFFFELYLQGDTLDYLGIPGLHVAGSQGVIVIAICQFLLMVTIFSFFFFSPRSTNILNW